MKPDELQAERTAPATDKPFIVRNPSGGECLILRSEMAARDAVRFHGELPEFGYWFEGHHREG